MSNKLKVTSYKGVHFKLSQIQWISIVLARYEAIQGARAPDCFTATTARNDNATI
ncbi:MAG: hypothetical protein LBS88_05755 [Tannerellaceae bacterium]|jgi:hypothetical protein|nr:hypothetical protein [Tannerellaceae bacterium]